MPLFIGSVHFLYPGMCVTAVNAFACFERQDTHYLGRQPLLECWSHAYFAQIIWFAIFLSLWCFFVWIFQFCLISHYQDANNEDKAKIELKYGFLFRHYRDAHIEWEGVQLLKKTFLAALTAASYQPDYYRQFLTIFCLALFAIFEAYVKPYRTRTANNLALASNFLILSIPAGQSLSQELSIRNELGQALIIVQCVFLLFCLVCFIVETRLHSQSYGEKSRMKLHFQKFAKKNNDGVLLIEEIQEKLLKAKLLLERRHPIASQYVFLAGLQKFNRDLEALQFPSTVSFRALYRLNERLIQHNRPFEFEFQKDEHEGSFDELAHKDPTLMINSPLRNQGLSPGNLEELPRRVKSKHFDQIDQNSNKKQEPYKFSPKILQESKIEDEKNEEQDPPNEGIPEKKDREEEEKENTARPQQKQPQIEKKEEVPEEEGSFWNQKKSFNESKAEVKSKPEQEKEEEPTERRSQEPRSPEQDAEEERKDPEKKSLLSEAGEESPLKEIEKKAPVEDDWSDIDMGDEEGIHNQVI